ncbi:MAG: single-stranded DNA-binding protein [bacterium]|nr:MAG: single-stranded DNA-binding protein [bacterium]
MAGLNKVMLIGRIGKDPDTYVFDNGNKKISFSLATTESYRDRDKNEWIEQTEWHNIAGYRYLAEKTFAKGDLVYVEGKIKTRKYTDKEQNERYITEIIADKINILLRKSADSSSYESESTAPPPAQEQNSVEDPPETAGTAEDDLPF